MKIVVLVLSVSVGYCQEKKKKKKKERKKEKKKKKKTKRKKKKKRKKKQVYKLFFFFFSECPISHEIYFTGGSLSEDGVAAAAVSWKQHRKPDTLLTTDLQLLQNPVSFLFCFILFFVFVLLCSFEGEFISGSL